MDRKNRDGNLGDPEKRTKSKRMDRLTQTEAAFSLLVFWSLIPGPVRVPEFLH